VKFEAWVDDWRRTGQRRKAHPATSEAEAIRDGLLRQGVLVGVGGVYGNVIRFQPPLVIIGRKLIERLPLSRRRCRKLPSPPLCSSERQTAARVIRSITFVIFSRLSRHLTMGSKSGAVVGRIVRTYKSKLGRAAVWASRERPFHDAFPHRDVEVQEDGGTLAHARPNCVQYLGGDFVLSSKNEVYRLDNQEKVRLFAGRK